MNLPNSYFEDFPIEFKEINPEDFPNFGVDDKILITPDEHGYIDTALQSNIDLLDKNTIVINAAVGQGKTYSIINIVKRYYEEESHIIFLASPYVSLVQQYYDKIRILGIPEADIYRYESIGNETHLDAWNSKIQIVTVNCLLGNPGEDMLINSESKRAYINYMVRKCEENNKKVVFIYDEIHDAIHNFKEEFVFNLWKWKNVICKNIILSATYNEASKIVIEYLAELTDNKVQIIESSRVRYPEKQSELYLHYNDAKAYKHNNDDIIAIIEKLIENGKNIDILCYSKILADSICSNITEGVGAILNSAGFELQNCTSIPEEVIVNLNNNRYNPDKCNIGTNFKTGVSIEKDNHAFVIIMPPKSARGIFKSKYGIFTGGVNSIIQALARQRKKGEIHIILPSPTKFDYESLVFEALEEKEVFKIFYESVRSESPQGEGVKYISINSQEQILSDYYNNVLKANVIDQIEFIESSNRENKIRLEYPEYRLFKLEKGEKYLSSKIDFFGRDLSSYITYCAVTNQFINCSLAEVNIKPLLKFTEGRIQSKLQQYYNDYMDEGYFNSLYLLINDKYKYHQFKYDIFNSYRLLYKPNNLNEHERVIKSFSEKTFETQLLAFLQRHFYSGNISFKSRYIVDGYLIDSPYTRGEFFLSCISHANRLASNLQGLDETTRDLVIAYQSLDYFRQKAIRLIQTIRSGQEDLQVLPNFNSPEHFIASEEEERFKQMLEILINKDYFINNEIFLYKNKFIRTGYRDNQERQSKNFYNYIKEDFFKGYIKRFNNTMRNERMIVVEDIYHVPNPDLVMDFVSSANLSVPMEYLPFYKVVDGKLLLIEN